MTQELVIKGSRAKGVLLLVVALAFTAGGLWLLTQGGSGRVMALITIAFFSFCAVVAAMMVIRPGEVRLYRDRFTVQTLWRSFDVRWDDVESFHLWRNPAASQTLPAWTYREGRKPTGALATASANLGAEGAMPGLLNLPPDKIVALMNRELEARRA